MNAKGNITTTGYLQWDEFQRLLCELRSDNKTKLRMLYATCAYTGLRIGDVLRLTWGDLSGDKFTLSEKKTGKRRTIALNEDLKEIVLTSRDGQKDSQLAFSNRSGEQMSRSYVNAELKRIFCKHKVSYEGNISSHLFRKTLGRRYLEKTDYSHKSLVLLMDMFNHSSLETTKRYLGLRQEEINEIYNII